MLCGFLGGTLLGCSEQDAGNDAYVETGSGASGSAPMLAQASGGETNVPPQKPPDQELPQPGEEKPPDNQDERGEQDPNTGDDQNPDSVEPQ
jgi:hypothetical protein